MSDVNLDSQFNWSPIRTGMEEMRAFASQTSSAIRSDIQGMFVGTVVATGIISGLHSIVEEAHEIHGQAEKFRIDAQNLQVIGSAAKEIGIPLETVARAMNLLELNAYKATQGTNAQSEALEILGIDANNFFSLRADEKVLALSAAYVSAADKGAAYANIAELIGKRNTEMIRLIQQGPDAIKEQAEVMGKYSNEQIEAIEKANKTWEILFQRLKVGGAGIILPFVETLNSLTAAVKNFGAATLATAAVDLSKLIVKPFTVIPEAIANLFGKSILPTTGEPAKASSGPATPESRAAIEGGESGGVGSVAGGGTRAAATKALDEQIKLSEKLAKVQRDAGFARLDDGSKLDVLQRELNALQAKELTLVGGTSEQQENLVAQAGKQKDIDELSLKIYNAEADAQEKIAKYRSDMAAQAEKDLEDARQQNVELALEVAGRKDLADRSRIEYEFDQKIKQAREDIAEAERDGFTEVAAINRALVTQLMLEKQSALAAHDFAQAEKDAAAAAQAAADARQRASETNQANARITGNAIAISVQEGTLGKETAQHSGESVTLQTQANALSIAAASARAEGNETLARQLEIEREQTEILRQQADRNAGAAAQREGFGVSPGTDFLGKLAAAGLHMGGMADAALISGGPSQYMRVMAMQQLESLTGKNMFSFIDRANAQKVLDDWAKEQNRIAKEASDKSTQAQIQYWQTIAAGGTPSASNPFTAMYGVPNFMTGTFGPANKSDVAQILLAELLDVARSQGINLASIDKKLTPVNVTSF
jgi:hypothetical protein